jgi:predicted O-methyltransferase YrrM
MKRFLIALLCLCTLLCSAAQRDLPEPYRSVITLPFDPHGWFVTGRQLAECIEEIEAETVIEIGSWLGASSRFIAEHLPPDGRLYAVDSWQGAAYPHLDSRRKQLYQLFLSNVIHAELTDTIIPVRMESAEAAKGLNVLADLIYFNGSLDYQGVYTDIKSWLPHLRRGGILCGNDWLTPEVRTAVEQIARERGFKIAADGNFWRFTY